MSQSIPVEMPTHPRSARGFALWQMGFRPFYLLASSFAALSIPVWALKFSGWLAHPYLRGPLWHAHEMLFGFTLAVIVGFLFTAGRNGSNRPTPTGTPLALLVALWVAGRVLVLTPFGWAAAIAGSGRRLCAFRAVDAVATLEDRRHCLLLAGKFRRDRARRSTPYGTAMDPSRGPVFRRAVVGRLWALCRALLAGAYPRPRRRRARLRNCPSPAGLRPQKGRPATIRQQWYASGPQKTSAPCAGFRS